MIIGFAVDGDAISWTFRAKFVWRYFQVVPKLARTSAIVIDRENHANYCRTLKTTPNGFTLPFTHNMEENHRRNSDWNQLLE